MGNDFEVAASEVGGNEEVEERSTSGT